MPHNQSLREESGPASEVRRSAGWHLNGVPLNIRTGLLAIALMTGFLLAASVGYRLFADGATNMTLPAGPAHLSNAVHSGNGDAASHIGP